MSTFKENYGIYKKFRPLYNQGLNDGEISRKLDCTRAAVCKWRSRNNLPSNYTHGTVRDKVLELYNEGYSKSEIVDKEITSYKYTMSILSHLPDNYPKVENKEAINGTLLGDAWVNNRPLLSFAHKSTYSDYVHQKKDRINLSCKISYEKSGSLNKGGKVLMTKCTYHTHPYWETLREAFYPDGNKIFPYNYLKDNFNWESLAYWYMDDGHNHKSGCYIAVCNFSKQADDIIRFMDSVFSFDCNIHGEDSLYIPKKYKIKMFNKIEKFVPESMKYKIKPL